MGSISVGEEGAAVFLYSGPKWAERGSGSHTRDQRYSSFRDLPRIHPAQAFPDMGCLKDNHEKKSWDREECTSFKNLLPDKSQDVCMLLP